MFASLFQRAIDSDPNTEQALYVDGYDVVQGDLPTPEQLHEIDGILLTGSGALHLIHSLGDQSLQLKCR